MGSRPIMLIVFGLVAFVAYSQITVQRQASAAFAGLERERAAQSSQSSRERQPQPVSLAGPRLAAHPDGAVRIGDPTIAYTGDNQTMAAAVKTARNTFEGFWGKVSHLAGDSVTDASIKVAVPYSGGREHIWMKNCIRRTLEIFVCTVSNKPESVDLSHGESYEFRLSSISDWMYWQGGKIHGAYSLRVMLPRLPADQAERLKAQLAPL